MTAAQAEEAPSLRVPFAKPEISLEAREASARILGSGWITTGPEVLKFEQELADYVGAKHGVAVSSCTAGIEIALRALALRPGAKVLTSTMTFCGAINAIIHAGLEPVLVDINEQTLMPDVATVEAAVRHVGRVDAMVVLHMAGHPAPVEELAAAAGLPLHSVIEDAAHALGTFVGDAAVGTLSAATCFSFYATKNLPIGEGGMNTTDDEDLAARMRQIRLHGMSHDAWKRYLPGASWRYEVDVAGIKANMTDVQAAIGRAQLQHFPRWQERREHLARAYDSRLARIEGVRTPLWPAKGRHAWHLYVIQLEAEFGVDRDTFMKQMAGRGVDCSVHFIPSHHQPYFQRVLARQRPQVFGGADAAFSRIVSLPFYSSLTDDLIDRVCEEIDGIRHDAIHVRSRPRVVA